jgi:hypothetical protein
MRALLPICGQVLCIRHKTSKFLWGALIGPLEYYGAKYVVLTVQGNSGVEAPSLKHLRGDSRLNKVAPKSQPNSDVS